MQSAFESFNLSQIPRSRNTHANSLATLATSSAQSLPRVILVENLCKPTEVGKNMAHIHQIRVGPSRMDSIVFLLKEDILPDEKSKADKVQRKAPRFWLSEDQKLYKISFFAHICYAYTLNQLSACSLPSARDRSNIILEVPRSNHKEQGKFKDNIIK